MTKLDIISAWTSYTLGFAVFVLSGLQATGYGPLTNDQAMPIVALATFAAGTFDTWVKKAQDLYDQIQKMRKPT